MVHKEHSNGEKSKVRGRPFVKGNKRGKFTCHVLDDSGHRSGDSGGIVDPHTFKGYSDPLKIEIEAKPMTQQEENKNEQENCAEIIECLEFVNGKNKLKVQFSKKSQRNFKVKIMLNDEIELKPVSFVTRSAAYDSWDMLKRILKK
jgi:hypothetical protein